MKTGSALSGSVTQTTSRILTQSRPDRVELVPVFCADQSGGCTKCSSTVPQSAGFDFRYVNPLQIPFFQLFSHLCHQAVFHLSRQSAVDDNGFKIQNRQR